jgi:hypothetical protein
MVTPSVGAMTALEDAGARRSIGWVVSTATCGLGRSGGPNGGLAG